MAYGTERPGEGGTSVSFLAFCWPFPQDCEMAAVAPGNSYSRWHSEQEERGRWKKTFLLSAGHSASLTKARKPTSCKKRGWIWGRRRSLVWELPLSGEVNIQAGCLLRTQDQSAGPADWFCPGCTEVSNNWTSALFLIQRLDGSPVLIFG